MYGIKFILEKEIDASDKVWIYEFNFYFVYDLNIKIPLILIYTFIKYIINGQDVYQFL